MRAGFALNRSTVFLGGSSRHVPASSPCGCNPGGLRVLAADFAKVFLPTDDLRVGGGGGSRPDISVENTELTDSEIARTDMIATVARSTVQPSSRILRTPHFGLPRFLPEPTEVLSQYFKHRPVHVTRKITLRSGAFQVRRSRQRKTVCMSIRAAKSAKDSDDMVIRR